MGKVFQSNAQLDGKVYDIPRLIHNYTPSVYEEPESQYLYDELYRQILKDVKDDNAGGKLHCPTFRKLIKRIKEYSTS